MPVIKLSLEHLKEKLGGKYGEKEIVETLPYLGLDIEGEEEEGKVSVEYSPNRPDYSSEIGIARSLRGILGIETGCPKYQFESSGAKVVVEDDEIRRARPFISAFFAEIYVTDELIRELIAMQEDLTNGIGRRRSKVAIGIHNAEVIQPPIRYYSTTNAGFSFVPLYGSKPETITTILKETIQGREYYHLLSSKIYPILEDSAHNVLSMPPIINGEFTRLKAGVRKMFFDITSTDERAGDYASAIMASMLSDTGAKVQSVLVESSSSRIAPDMSEKRMNFDLDLANRILGLELSLEESRMALVKSRLDLIGTEAIIPPFRADIIHPIDLVEEVGLGYGVARLTPQSISTSLSGSINSHSRAIGKVVEALVGLGMTEIFNLSLTSNVESSLAQDQNVILKVKDARSESFEYLKSEILPSLLRVLGSSIHEEYPQKIFEVAPVFVKGTGGETGVAQSEHIAGAIAHSSANFTEIKSLVESFLRLTSEESVSGLIQKIEFRNPEINSSSSIFAKGRFANLVSVLAKGSERQVGLVGEIAPEALEKLGLKVPVSAFEIELG